MKEKASKEKLVETALLVQKHFPDFYLTGETALMLKHNHRESKDLDFFAPDFSLHRMASRIARRLPVEKVWIEGDSVNCTINGVKVSFVCFPFENAEPLEKWGQLKMASDLDIFLNKRTRRVWQRAGTAVVKTPPSWKERSLRQKPFCDTNVSMEKHQLICNWDRCDNAETILVRKMLYTDCTAVLKEHSRSELKELFLKKIHLFRRSARSFWKLILEVSDEELKEAAERNFRENIRPSLWNR